MPGPKSDKIWADAIRKAVHEYGEVEDEGGRKEKVRYLNLLATNLVRIAAKEGDPQMMAALREIGDRLDGKPHQSQTTNLEPSDALTELLKAIDGNRNQRDGRAVEESDMAAPQSVLHH